MRLPISSLSKPHSQVQTVVQRLRQVDLNLLPVLHMLLDTCSVSEAARRLGSTQPAVSRMLERLRRELDDPLLVKSSNTMVRTARADDLRPFLDDLLEVLQTVYRPQQDYRLEEESRVCTIGANDSLQAMFASTLIRSLRTRASLALIRFKPVPYPNPMRALLNGEIDLMLAMTEKEDPPFRSQLLFRSNFVCMCSNDNERIGDTASIDAIAASPYLDVSHMGHVSGATDLLFAEHQRRKNTVAAMSSFLAAPGVIAGSDMVCLVPEYLAPTLAYHPGVKLVPLHDVREANAIRMIWHNITHFDPFMTAVRDMVVQAANGQFASLLADAGRPEAG